MRPPCHGPIIPSCEALAQRRIRRSGFQLVRGCLLPGVMGNQQLSDASASPVAQKRSSRRLGG